MRLVRRDSRASTEVTWALGSGMMLALVQIFLDALGFAQQVGGVRVGNLDEFPERLQSLLELLRELEVLLVLPGISQSGKARLERSHAILEIQIEALQFFSEAPHFLRVHDCLGHIFSFSNGSVLSQHQSRRERPNESFGCVQICPALWDKVNCLKKSGR